jgi:hypothetical protein
MDLPFAATGQAIVSVDDVETSISVIQAIPHEWSVGAAVTNADLRRPRFLDGLAGPAKMFLLFLAEIARGRGMAAPAQQLKH